MIKIIKKKHIIIIVSTLILVIGGYYLYSTSDIEISDKISDISNYSEASLGDVQLVSSQNVYEVAEESIDSNEVEAETTEEDYFEESRLQRDKMYSETIEVYENILSNSSISSEQKLIAENEITAIMNIKNGIAVAENLIKVKGFEDVVIFVNDATATVVVKSASIEEEEIAQIQNIVTKQLGIEAGNISITSREK